MCNTVGNRFELTYNIELVRLTGFCPFLDENNRQCLIQGLIDWSALEFFSDEESRSFIKRLLVTKPSERMSLEAAIGHEWFKTNQM